jgi:mono/diheme cytochrome c family protein
MHKKHSLIHQIASGSGFVRLLSILIVLGFASFAVLSVMAQDAPAEEEGIARPSNPGFPGEAINLVGDIEAGLQIYVDNCQKCHGEEGVGGVENPGSDETIPELNPIDETLIDPDLKVYAMNLDFFLEHGSTPPGDNPKEVMPAWGDEEKLTPQQIADVIYYVISLNQPMDESTPVVEATPSSESTPESAEASSSEEEEGIARPSNPGFPGEAVNLEGDVEAGMQIYVDNCQKCHGEEGVGGVDNPGSDETIPELNPIDATLIDQDAKVYAINLDFFIEHGSTPPGDNPKEVMPAWGDEEKLTPQQIADVISYIIDLNQP